MFNEPQFRSLIVRPVLEHLQNWSESAEELLILTFAAESLGGTYIKQIEGPALGIYGMEPDTYNYLWATWLPSHSHYAYKALQAVYMSNKPPAEMLVDNIRYATIMARLNYCRFSEPLPAASDIKSLAQYYKKYWNTKKGKATVKGAIISYNHFMGLKKKT